jgi:hypothetical protein
MDAKLSLAQSNNKKDRDSILKQTSGEGSTQTISDFEISYEKVPLNLGLSARQWLHEKLHSMVVAKD